MFYFIVSRIPIISSVEEGKFMRIFIIGTICYLILHAFLYSAYNDGSELIQNYRSYLYYLWGIDLALTGILIKFFGSRGEEIEYDDSETDNDNQVTNNVPDNKMSQEEIKKKLEEIKKYENELAMNEPPYPFIKKEKNINQQENTNNAKKELSDKDKNKKQISEVEKKNEFTDTELPLYKLPETN
ncbi:hypothetical protein Catovirus_2_132 [Catovirus CTV1]|uniref:Uncharacterized protein n=1 Tax=Catovirus CTV1 TaxID=1977631 RepID=A0A1V0SBU7_9VIRU|nr:hypothetical protein Catovirus_2_132 [Catovirus CTV1]